MSNTDRFSMLERWADGMEKLEQYYEGKYGPPATPAQLPPITIYDAMLEAIVDGIERAKRNINKKSTTYHSDSVAYVKTVPSGDVHYASLEQIGGKTLAWNQLADETVVYSSTGNYAFVSGTQFVAGHKYYVNFDYSGTAGANISVNFYAKNSGANHALFPPVKTPTIATSLYSATSDGTTTQNEGNCWNYAVLDGATSITNITLIDLTLMYGAGNEPSTVQEFTSQFPAIVYPYSAPTLLSAGVTDVVSKDANDTTLQTVSIPASIQALEGYGWSAGTAYNYVDFERKVFVKCVDRVDLGGLSWGYTSGTSSRLTSNEVSNMKTSASASATANIICAKYIATSTDNVYGHSKDKIISVHSSTPIFWIYDSAYTDPNTFKTAMDGVYVYYEMETPIETDISAYLTDDNLIEVEAGGTLTFENVNGDDYRIDVPSSVTFVVGEP